MQNAEIKDGKEPRLKPSGNTGREDFSEEQIEMLRNNSEDFSYIPGSYCYCHYVSNSESNKQLPAVSEGMPFKVTGMVMILVKSGEFDFEIDLKQTHVGPDQIIIIPQNALLKISHVNSENAEGYILFLSPKFLHSVNINMTAIYVPELVNNHKPEMKLDEEEVALLLKYFNLLNVTAADRDNLQLQTLIASSLISALVYQLVKFHYKRALSSDNDRKGTPSRRLTYVHDFLKLVHANYLTERRVNFYANKLCITNKYLSVIVRETTGRSPGEWIGDFVCMEAKALLRYSGKNIQQVAYALNFSNQASFGKFFKSLTGMTPSQYQKT